MSGSHLSKDFFELVKAIGESKSKQEEDRIIVQEIAYLKRRINEPGGNAPANKKRQKEFLIRLMYVEMLGHDASFGYIKAVELTASTSLLQKRVGYLCCSLVLSPTHEFRFMIINQLQRDLNSSNHLEACSALMAVCKLVTVEMIPAVLPMVVELLRHDTELVRKKAVMTMHRFHQLNPDAVQDYGDQFRRTLCDRDPSVMGAALCILHDLAEENAAEYKDLVPSYVSILKQIMEHRLPREFDYHRIPAPWIQIRLLKILALLGQADQQASEGMYEVLHDVMRRADTGINVGYAIIYECVRCVTTIYPNSTLLDSAAASISRFISSDNHNLKYLGVTGLAAIVKDHPRYATAHQMAVIDCLEDPDETLKRKTLDLLYRMTNPVNVEFISDKLTQFLREATDVFLRTELVSRITQCAERYAPNNSWYIQTMTNVFELGGELVEKEVAHNLLRLIAEGSGEDDELDMELRKEAVETYLELLDRAVLPDILVCVMSWVLGEYAYLSTTMGLEETCERLCELAERPFQNEDETRAYVLTAVMKITAQLGHSISSADLLIRKYSKSRSTDIQQRCFEFLALMKSHGLMTEVLPVDASCEDIEVDPNMEFLDGFVEEAAAQGAPRYSPPEDSDEEDTRNRGNELNFDAYEKPEIPYSVPKRPGHDADSYTSGQNQSWGPSGGNVPPPNASGPWGAGGPTASGAPSGYGNNQPPAQDGGQYGNPRRGNIKHVWGPSGMASGGQDTNEPPPAGPSGYPNGPPGGYGQPPPGPQQNYGYGQQPPAPYGYNQPPDYARRHSGAEPYNDDAEEEDDIPDEKQKMASALFGGMPGVSQVPRRGSRGGGNANPRRTSRDRNGPRRRPSREMSREEPPAPPQQPKVEVDLLDISFGDSNPNPATAPSHDPFGSSVPPATNPDPFNMGGMQAAVPSTLPEFSYNGGALIPLQINTEQFGSRWGSCNCEKKNKVSPTSIQSLHDYMNAISKVGFHPVQAIDATNEAIAAAKLSVGMDMDCLVHTKLRSAGYLDVLVRTTDPGFTDQVLQFLSHVLQ